MMVPSRISRSSRVAGMVALAFCVGWSGIPAAFALGMDDEVPGMSVFAHAQQVSDSEMGHMRGRYVAPNEIVRFGIDMVSQWVTPTGTALTAGEQVTVNLPQNSSPPTVSFVPNLSITTTSTTPPPADTSVQAATGASFNNVSGVGQGIQVAGNNNSIANNANVLVTTANIGGPTGSTTVSVPAPLADANGDTVAANFSATGTGVSITVPGHGKAVQQISGAPFDNPAAGGTGLMQMAQVTGDLQQIQNVTNLTVQLNAAQPINPSNLSQSLSLLQGLQSHL